MRSPSAPPPKSDVFARAVLAVLLGLAFMPLLLTPIPAMVDYPNHLARMFILARDGTPEAHPFYQVTWALYPNLAMDLIVPPAGRLIGVETATRLFTLLSQLLVVSGAMVLERVVKGEARIAGFVAVIFLYSLPFAWGFLNFEFGLGVALWGIAAALALQERGWAARLAVNAVFCLLLFTAHFFTLGIYGFALGLHEVWRAAARRSPLPETLGRLAVLALPAAALVAVMALTGGSVGGEGTNWFLEMKPRWAFYVLSGYSLILSIAGAVVLIVLIYCLARHGALRFVQSGAWLAIGFAVLYLAMPSRLLDTSFVDVRVLVAAALILPAFVSVTFPDKRWQLVTLGCVSALALVQIATVAWIWTDYRSDYAAVRDSFKLLGKGARVLIGHSGSGDDPPFGNLSEYPIYNAPILAVNDADAFVPNLFAAKGKQPVSARPGWERLTIPHAGPAPVALLKQIAEAGAPPGTPLFIRSWPQDYEFLYMLGPHGPNPLPALLDELASGRRFVLYGIRRP